MAKELMLHAGGVETDRAELEKVITPERIDRWQPIPHHTLFDLTQQTIIDNGFKIARVQMGIAKEGNRFFALMEMEGKGDYHLMVGLRNSHDKTFPAGLAVGSRVFVCDNLAFSGEISIARKHTTYIMKDLPGLVIGAVGRIALAKVLQDTRIEAYRQYYLDDFDAHDLIIRSVDYGIISNQIIPQVLHQWREPEHDVFKERTAWSLFNGFTEVMKRFPASELPKKTVKLHGMLDKYVGMATA